MSAILDLPEIRDRLNRWSAEDFERLGELGVIERRSELIRGMIIRKTPKSPLHVYLTELIAEFCRERLEAGYVVREEAPLRLADDSAPEPDVAVMRGTRKDFRGVHPTTALLVVEVAFTSAALDREKASIYAEAKISEYWVVLSEEKAVEVYREPVDGGYLRKQVYVSDEVVVCESIPNLQVKIHEWFAA